MYFHINICVLASLIVSDFVSTENINDNISFNRTSKIDTEERIPTGLVRLIVTTMEKSLNKTEDSEARAIYWFPTPCSFRAEGGYTCYSCRESLHCLPGNAGLLAFCYGRRPYCSNGVCSEVSGEKCQHTHIANTTIEAYDEVVTQPTKVDAVA